MPKFAANLTMMFTDIPFLDRFQAAANAGFKAVEFLSPFEYSKQELSQKLTQHNLQQVLFNTSVGNTANGEWGLNALPGREKEAKLNIDLALHYALALNCPAIHVMAGVVPIKESYNKYKQTFIDNVRYAADQFAKHNINVLLEALSPGVKPDYLFSSQYQSAELVDLIDRPNVFIQFDVFHAQMVDGNLTRFIEQHINKIKHIQIASAPDRHEPDEGEINYSHIFNLLDKLNYQHWVGCEYQPRTKTTEGLNWLTHYL